MGDAILRRIRELREKTRLEEDIYRYGGEEFVQIMENISEEKLIYVARRYQSLIRAITLETLSNGSLAET